MWKKIMLKVFTIFPFVNLIALTISAILRNTNTNIPMWFNVMLTVFSVFAIFELLCIVALFVLGRILKPKEDSDKV